MTAAEFATYVKKATRSGAGYRALCPAHADQKPSLTFRDGDNGRFVVYCHKGCSVEEIMQAVGLSEQDLFNDEPQGAAHGSRPRGTREQLGKIVAEYDYPDERGNLLYQVVGYASKEFRQRKPNGHGGWTWRLNGVRRVPYRLPELTAAVEKGDRIYIVEGEKDVDCLAKLGLAATCNAGGAGKWSAEFSEHLRDARVAILPDNDEAGRDHADSVARLLQGVAGEIKVVHLHGLAEKQDVSDWLDKGSSRNELERLVEEGRVWQAPSSRFVLKTMRDLKALPPREWLVNGILPAGCLAELHGRPGAGKTFLVLSLAASVSTGISFYGHEVKAGPVVYVAAEGDDGLLPRLQAWCAVNNIDGLPNLHVISHSVNLLHSSDVNALLNTLGSLSSAPVLVIVDTLARCMVGGDENSAKDMGLLVQSADSVRNPTGAAVLLVHHTGHQTGRERGSSALRGAVDTMMALDDRGSTVGLVCEKQKDGAPFDRVSLQLVPGSESMVFVPAGSTGDRSEHSVAEADEDMLAALAKSPGGLTTSKWKKACSMPESSFHVRRKCLMERGLVTGGGGRGRPYQISDRGKAVITPTSNITPE